MRRSLRKPPAQGGVPLTTVARYLDGYLKIRSIPDVPGIVNGLQHRNSGRITSVVAAVDACVATIAAAANRGTSLLLVHHGLPDATKPDAVLARRRRDLRRTEVALYACHIPLDLHPTVGNNILLAGMLGLTHVREFGRYGRRHIGIAGRYQRRLSDLASLLDRLLGTTTYAVRGGPSATRRVAVVTGNGARWIEEAARSGIDTLVTGEAGHHDALHAEERRLNLLCAGHYATETLGVKALAAHLSARFDLPWAFVDHPTGL